MSTTHDIGISWMDCPVCAELHREVERADAEADKAWETYSSVDFQYREARDDGRVGFGTKAWTQWHDLLDQLRHAYYDATDTARARLDAWGESICEHAKPQPAVEPAEAPASTEKKATISMTEEAAQERPKVACVLFDAAYRLTTLVADTTDNPDAKAALAGIDALLFNLGYTDDDGIDADDDESCGFPETTVFAYDAKQGRCRAFHVGGLIATAAACAKAHRDGYLAGLRDARDLLDGMIADHNEDADDDGEACTDEGGA